MHAPDSPAAAQTEAAPTAGEPNPPAANEPSAPEVAPPAPASGLPRAGFHPIDPRWVAAARIGGVLRLIVPFGLLAVAVGLDLTPRVGIPRLTALLAGGSGLAALLAWRLVAPGLAFARWRYRMTDRVLECSYGVIFHRSVVVPLSRIQNVDVRRGPIDRAFGLASVVVRTAGTADEAVGIPGLDEHVAARLRDHLVARSLQLEQSGTDDAV